MDGEIIDLNVEDSADVPQALSDAAETFRASECDDAKDKEIWDKIAAVLDGAAAQVEEILESEEG